MTGLDSTWTFAYRRHGGVVKAYLGKRLASREEVEDLCQETFTRALAARDRLREPEKLRGYLLSTAHNLLVNHLRRRGKVRAESDLGQVVELESLAAASGAGADGEADQRGQDLALALSRELDRLPGDQRRAFELGAIQRWPYAEIAAATGWSVNKVKIDVYRARKTLMAHLRDYSPSARIEGKSGEAGA
jgi:RNA polymerase sigma-70 factor, ECF subfamily